MTNAIKVLLQMQSVFLQLELTLEDEWSIRRVASRKS
jgi:hypothetical protein